MTTKPELCKDCPTWDECQGSNQEDCLRRTPHYKAFRVEDDGLVSAFEGRGINLARKLHYKVRGVTVDPKPDPDCRGLMLFDVLQEARKFLRACPSHLKFVLHVVKPLSPVTFLKGESYHAGFTDSLYVGRRIGKKEPTQSKPSN